MFIDLGGATSLKVLTTSFWQKYEYNTFKITRTTLRVQSTSCQRVLRVRLNKHFLDTCLAANVADRCPPLAALHPTNLCRKTPFTASEYYSLIYLQSILTHKL